MRSRAFQQVLQATGYLGQSGQPAPGLTLADDEGAAKLRTVFENERVGLSADAVFSSQNVLTSIFKDAGDVSPTDEDIRDWHEAAWNISIAPLLWIITPTDVRLYNCYASPPEPSRKASVAPSPLDRFVVDSEDRLRALDAACGRLATETGAFWSSKVGKRINRKHRVDRELLGEISALEECLVGLTPESEGPEARALARDLAQRFIGRCIFTWYLLDRGLAQPFLPAGFPAELSGMFATTNSAFALFDWLRETINGDLFPMQDPGAEQEHLTSEHLAYIRDFIEGRSLIPERKGQGRLFRFRFNAIPIDLISSIYQQFARSSAEEEAESQGLHYTPVELVHLTLDPVFEGLSTSARVIDPACGSGAFLVEAFRRLVWRATGGNSPTRTIVRRILYRQLFGVDINRSALGIAAFSLYLAALELDEEPIRDIGDLKFDHLIGETLFETDSLAKELPEPVTVNTFDAIVGNPPWTFVGQDGRSPKRVRGDDETLRPRRSPDQAFLTVAARLAGESGRIGMIMKATPFFSVDIHAVDARRSFLKRLAPVALINLSHLRREELFPSAVGPALIFFSRCTLADDPERLVVGSIPWTPDFKRTGVFHIGPGEIRSIALHRALAVPGLLKAGIFGSVRDTWLIERLHTEFPTLESQLEDLNVRADVGRGQGYIVGRRSQKDVPRSHRDLLTVKPEDFTPFRVDSKKLKRLDRKTLHRPRSRSIYRAPLVLCPKGAYTRGAERGRYCVTLVEQDVLYTQNLYGISFFGVDPRLARVMSGILNSSITTFQLAFGGPTWGLERPTAGPKDVLSLRVPSLGQCEERSLTAVMRSERAAAREPHIQQRLDALDDAVFDLYKLEQEERTIVKESVSRAKGFIFETLKERRELIRPPDVAALQEYAGQVAQTVNAYLRAQDERHVEAVIYTRHLTNPDLAAGVPGVTAVRFVMAPGGPRPSSVVRTGELTELDTLVSMLRGRFEAGVPPYLNERRQLRLYGDKDLFILKPSETRYWTRTTGLNDADVILADHWIRRRDAVVHA